MSESKITCPSCGHSFNTEEAIAKGLEERLAREFREKNRQAAEQIEQRNQELAKRYEEFREMTKSFQEKQDKAREEYQQRLKEDREKITLELKLKAEKEAAEQVSLKLEELRVSLEKKQKENLELQKREIDFLKKEQELKELKERMDIELQRKLLEVRKQSEEEVAKKYAEQFELKEREYKKVIDDQRKQAEEMKRKMEQGSMQLQGEVQELAIEEELRASFPFDLVQEVSKGARGADCIQVVRNGMMQECGRIIYESKRAKAFSADWILKLKEDMRSAGADVAVLVTQAMPRDQECFALVNGVWVCSFSEYKALACALREGLIRVKTASEANENKGEKMQMLYSYLTGNEFKQQVEAIVEGFSCLRDELEKEKRAMQLIWKKREKQIEKVVTNTIHLYGSVKGIAGASVKDIELLQGDQNLLDEGETEPPVE